jgi:hypothetical protein
MMKKKLFLNTSLKIRYENKFIKANEHALEGVVLWDLRYRMKPKTYLKISWDYPFKLKMLLKVQTYFTEVAIKMC